MNNTNDRSRIVELHKRQSGTDASHADPRSEHVGTLLSTVQDLARRHVMALVGGMFDNVDDALFDLAEKAENNAVQTQYFDGMRSVRKQRPHVERHFSEAIAENFAQLAAGRRHARGKAESENRSLAANPPELSLVEEQDLEESLAVTSMTAKAETRLAGNLLAVNQRLAVICGGTRVDNPDNPVGPDALARAFGRSLGELDVEVRVKLIVYKLFERYVLSALDPLYNEVNHLLAQAGVLPNLRLARSQRHAAGSGTRTAPSLDASTGEDGQDQQSAFRGQLVETLQSLLAERRQGHAYTHAATGPSLSPAELLGALSVLQDEVSRNTVAMPSDVVDPASLSTDDVRVLKEQLVGQIQRLRGEARTHVSGADEDTIDLVSMLFEYILQDHNLPMEMQVLLARLQIPYLKVAILDRRLFAQGNHPARRLLDELADAAKGWSAESDRDQALLKKVRSVVETLLAEFDDDIDVFNRQLEDFRKFLDSSNRRAQLAEQRAAEATRGREKLQQARRRAAQEILSRIEGRDLPALVNGILTRAWANYLVLTLLRHGEDSSEFRTGLRFVDDFVWSVGPLHSAAERQRLEQLMPLLEKSLRHGLATVAFQDSDVETLMRQLNALYDAQLGMQADSAAPAAADVDAPVPIPESMEVIASPETLEEAGPVPPAARNATGESPDLERVRNMKVGNWVEFSADGERPERAKLSWISPISGKYLFVNRRGLKVADKTREQLAAELASGKTVLLEELPLFDRALDAIVERLRANQTDRESTPPAS